MPGLHCFVLQENNVLDPSAKLLTCEVVEILTKSYRNSEHARFIASRIEEIALFVSNFFSTLYNIFCFVI